MIKASLGFGNLGLNLDVKVERNRSNLLKAFLVRGHQFSLKAGLEVIKNCSCSTQLRTKFQLLIKSKITTNKEVSCFKFLRCCIYHANKC